MRGAALATPARRGLRRLVEGFGGFFRQSRLCLDVERADLLHGLDLRRQQLLGEVERDACNLPELPL